MNDIKFRMYKDNNLIYENTCPAIFFTSVIPLSDQNLFDYIELEWKGVKKIHRKEKIINEWKP